MAEKERDSRRPVASTLVSSLSPVSESVAPADTELFPAESSPARVHVQEAFVQDDGFASRYERGDVLGQGGMGEVRLCRDHRVGRDIALKVVRPGRATPELTQRFVREARVQGQLEHPAIVPVYDMGVAPDDNPYFTMKRVRGHTLERVLEALRATDGVDEDLKKRFSKRKLLTAFASLSLAVDFVHGRGVVHRDVKPANVMLGDFGEVYLLDWGLARIGEETALHEDGATPHTSLASLSPGITTVGTLLGTPGYMAPEQLSLEGAMSVDARADVYSLGAILFEILTLQQLHHGTAGDVLVRSTRAGADARASLRVPEVDVPPELEAICVQATATEPAARIATARALSEAVERYLDGDRDLELRRRLSETHARAAFDAIERALTTSGGEAVDARRAAMRELSRSLAMDAKNPDAMRALVGLLMQPPRDLPPEVKEEMDQLARDQIHVGARAGAIAYASMLVNVPLVLWMGMRNGWAWVVFVFAVLAAGASWATTRVRRPSAAQVWGVYLISLLSVAGLSTFFGPYLLVPGVAAASALIYSATNDRSMRLAIIALACTPIVVPLGLEAAGLVEPSMRFVPEGILIVPRAVDFPPLATHVYLLAANLALVVTSGMALVPFRDGFDDAQRRIRLLAWQLRQLVPETPVARKVQS